MDYHFIHIDTSAADIGSAAVNFKALRLVALQQSPHAFASSWETESLFTDEVWLSTLCQKDVQTFACIVRKERGDEWVAQVSLRGPLTTAEFELPQESGQQLASLDHDKEKWQMLGLYTSIDHRGKGLGSKLCSTALDYLSRRKSNVGGQQTVVRIMVKPENTATLRLYKGLGFMQTGLCTLEEALRANGDGHLLPKDDQLLGPKFKTRAGIIMAMEP
jgi:ribosomal protein S18 acetylase RimI-like enzyme